MSDRTRVLLVTGSPLPRRLLAEVPTVEVVGLAATASVAMRAVRQLHPAVVLLDLDMLGASGLTTLDAIMHECPTPVVALGGSQLERAVQLGAVACVMGKGADGTPRPDAELKRELRSHLELAARVKVIRSLGSGQGSRAGLPRVDVPVNAEGEPAKSVIVIGASTGGPEALQELLCELPHACPAAILIVQHLPGGMTNALADHLSRQVGKQVGVARSGDLVQGQMTLLAPGDRHLLVNADGRVVLSTAPPIGGYRPAINVTMRSVAEHYRAAAYAVVLTGMGADGAEGVVAIHRHGGRTFAQKEATCLIDGMPRRAIETGAVQYVAPPAGIARMLRAELSSGEGMS